MTNKAMTIKTILCGFIIALILTICSCASSKTRSRYDKPDRKKMKPCNCSHFVDTTKIETYRLDINV